MHPTFPCSMHNFTIQKIAILKNNVCTVCVCKVFGCGSQLYCKCINECPNMSLNKVFFSAPPSAHEAPLSAHDVFTKYRVDIKNMVQLEVFVDHFISRKIILAEHKESVTMESLLSTIDSELESGIDGCFLAMLDVMKTFGTTGLHSLAENIEQDLHQGKLIPKANIKQFCADDTVADMFLKLAKGIRDILKANSCEFALLRGTCVKTDKLVEKLNSLPCDLVDKIKATKDLDELLEVLLFSPYCNWRNVCVFEKMAAFTHQTEAQELIANYKRIVFFKKLTDVMQDFTEMEVTGTFYTRVEEKWSKNFEDITLEDIENHWLKLRKILDAGDLELLLENVVKGSTEFHWVIPVQLASHARLSAFKNWCDLEDVSCLSIGDNVIKNDQLEFTKEHISVTTGILT